MVFEDAHKEVPLAL